MSTRQRIKKNGKAVFFAVLLWIAISAGGNVCADTNSIEYIYIPEDKTGNFSVSVDGLRMLQASYKGINLLAQWGEFYSDRRAFAAPVYDYPKKIPVRVERSKDCVEYLWKYWDFEKGYRQINRVIVTTNKITSDITLEISKDIPKEIKFHPVFFPGYQVTRNSGQKETRLRGVECEVKRANGEKYKLTYPEDAKPVDWLPEDTREVTFFFRKDKVRFGFSSLDDSMKFTLKANAAFRTNPTRHVTEGEITLLPKTKPYKTTLHMEIAVGEEADQPMVPPEALTGIAEVSIKTRTENLANVFLSGSAPRVDIEVNNWNDAERSLDLVVEVKNYANQDIYNANKKVTVKPQDKEILQMELPIDTTGIFSLVIQAKEKGKVVGKETTRIGIVPQPAKQDPEKTYFGSCIGSFLHGAWHPIGQKKDYPFLDRVCKLLHALGIKKVRLMDWPISWKYVEPEPGKFVFDPHLDKVVETFSTNGISLWYTGGMFEGGYPEWAVTQEAYANHGEQNPERVKIPKDFSLYENYIYQVVSHLKGKVKYYEMDNEPQFSDVKIKAKFYEAFYKGAKRADPDCVVLGASIADCSPRCLDWLEEMLKETNGKYLDIISFHYPYSGVRLTKPENPNDEANIRRLLDLAGKYNLRVWDGEEGKENDWRNVFPYGEFLPSEKESVNINLRLYLLMMTHPEIEHIALCHATSPFSLLWEPCDYYSSRTGSMAFWQMGSSVSPWGIAHANLASLFEGAKFKKRINFGSEGVYGLLFEDRDGLPLAALWSPDAKSAMDIPLSASLVDIISAMGEIKKQNGETLSLILNGEPVYLKGKNKRDFAKIASSMEKAKVSVPQDIEAIKDALDIDFYYSLDGKGINVLLRNKVAMPITVDSLTVKVGPEKPIVSKNIEIKPYAVENLFLETQIEKKKTVVVVGDVSVKNIRFSKNKELVWPSLEKAREAGLLIARKTDHAPSLTGNLNDYADADPLRLNKREEVLFHPNQVLRKNVSWNGEKDLSVTAYLLYDASNLYFAAKVTDNKYVNDKTGKDSWNGDSIQMAFDTLNDSSAYVLNIGGGYNANDHEISIALTKEGPYQWRRSFGNGAVAPDGPIPGARLKITKINEETLFYEFAIPFKELYPLFPALGREVRFNFIVNDDDGEGRNKWIGITGGIGEKKDPGLFRKIMFLE